MASRSRVGDVWKHLVKKASDRSTFLDGDDDKVAYFDLQNGLKLVSPAHMATSLGAYILLQLRAFSVGPNTPNGLPHDVIGRDP